MVVMDYRTLPNPFASPLLSFQRRDDHRTHEGDISSLTTTSLHFTCIKYNIRRLLKSYSTLLYARFLAIITYLQNTYQTVRVKRHSILKLASFSLPFEIIIIAGRKDVHRFISSMLYSGSLPTSPHMTRFNCSVWSDLAIA